MNTGQAAKSAEVVEAEAPPASPIPESVPEPLQRADIRDLGAFLKGPRGIPNLAVIGVFFLGVIAFLYFARPFFLPVVLALLMHFLLKPVVQALARLKIPEPIGAGLVLAVLLFAVGDAVTRLGQPAADWVAKAPESLRQIERKVHRLLQRAESATVAPASTEPVSAAAHNEAPLKVPIQSNLVDTAFSYTTSFLGGVLETIVLLYFFLASGDLFLQKLVKILPTSQDKEHAVTIAHEVQYNISTFLFTITIINACLGVVVGTALFVLGMKNPVLWGILAGLLNFIPYFGPFTVVAVLSLAGMLTFESAGQALLAPLIYLGVHALEANFITPMVLGRRLTLNPVVIFISLIFWSWLWGVPGALLAVPMLMIFKILCDHFKPLGSVGEFLSK
jgi:predicted PurR-regulated permease PerM